MSRKNSKYYNPETSPEELRLLHLRCSECFYCGITTYIPSEYGLVRKADEATRDHKVPISRGGLDNEANIVIACNACNFEKDDLTDEEYSNIRRWGCDMYAILALERKARNERSRKRERELREAKLKEAGMYMEYVPYE